MANARDWRKGAGKFDWLSNLVSTVIGPKLDKLPCEINSSNAL